MSKRKKIILPILMGFVAMVLYLVLLQSREENRTQIQVSGNIEVTTVDVAFKIPGKIERLLVEEGDTDRPEETLGVLKGTQQFREVVAFGNALHIMVRQGEDPSAFIVPYLSRWAITAKRMEKIPPSLEDVFVSLVESKKGESQNAL